MQAKPMSSRSPPGDTSFIGSVFSKWKLFDNKSVEQGETSVDMHPFCNTMDPKVAVSSEETSLMSSSSVNYTEQVDDRGVCCKHCFRCAEPLEPLVSSDLQREMTFDEEEKDNPNEADLYLMNHPLARACPERFFALVVTMILEIPVLLMISGGSDALCQLIGRSRYQLLMGFLPLTSAISGNVGLQASTLTTRAISHRHVTSRGFKQWFLCEVGAAVYLGMAMGLVIGSMAYFASDMDLAFGLTILIAQFISIVTAGVTGTFAPLLFSFFFERDSGKWGGPLETAVQDIVGSFAMVVVSYHLLKFLGPGPVDPDDTCGSGGWE